MLVVASRDHHGSKGARQQLAQRQNHHLLLQRVRRLEAAGFQHVLHPAHEIGLIPELRIHRQRQRSRLQMQRLQQLLAGGIVLQPVPLAAVLQRILQIGQPLRQAARLLQRLPPVLDLQRLHTAGMLPLQPSLPMRPLRLLALTQPGFQRLHPAGRHRRSRHGLRQLQPFQHGITPGLWCTGTQQTHQLAGRTRGRQFPAGLVTHRQVLCLQLGADAARQGAVAVHQRDQAGAPFHCLLHAGSRPRRLVLQIARAMPLHRCHRRRLAGLLPELRQVDRASGLRLLLQPACIQRLGERIALVAPQQDQRIGRFLLQRFEQDVGAIGRTADPGQRHLRHQLLVTHRGRTQAVQQLRQQRLHPDQPLLRWLRLRLRCQLLRRLAHPPGQPGGLLMQTGRLQQLAGCQQVLRRVLAVITSSRHMRRQPRRPVERRLEARQQPCLWQLRPVRAHHRQQLRIRQQHHRACRIGPEPLQLLLQLRAQGQPSLLCDCHHPSSLPLILADPPTSIMRSPVSVTIRPSWQLP